MGFFRSTMRVIRGRTRNDLRTGAQRADEGVEVLFGGEDGCLGSGHLEEPFVVAERCDGGEERPTSFRRGGRTGHAAAGERSLELNHGDLERPDLALLLDEGALRGRIELAHPAIDV